MLIGENGTFNNPHKTQVYHATHSGEGNRLPYMNRGFISFSFGGRYIEDFNLIATVDGKLNKNITPEFQDLTSTYDVVDGQFYWGTYYKENKLEFTLSTDGITESEISDFINWFAPGMVRELILAEHPNRAIMARVSEPPAITMVPFEKEVEITINGGKYKTSTTEYKGDISLSLVMDEPFWYSKTNLLAQLEGGNWTDKWYDVVDDDLKYIYSNKDALKIIVEDKVPSLSMISDSLILGNGIYYDYDTENSLVGYAIVGKAKVGTNEQIIRGVRDNIELIEQNSQLYLYYAGNAPSKMDLEFKSIYSGGTSWIGNIQINNSDSSRNQILKFKIPAVFKDYIKILSLFPSTGPSPIEADGDHGFLFVRNYIRNNIRHKHMRKWALMILDYMKNKYETTQSYNYALNDSFGRTFYKQRLELFIKSIGNSPTYGLSELKFNGKNNEYKGKLFYRVINTDARPSSDDFKNYGEINELEEDISDMLDSEFPTLYEQNSYDENGKIVPLPEDADSNFVLPENTKLCHIIKYLAGAELYNVTIKYLNKYY